MATVLNNPTPLLGRISSICTHGTALHPRGCYESLEDNTTLDKQTQANTTPLPAPARLAECITSTLWHSAHQHRPILHTMPLLSPATAQPHRHATCERYTTSPRLTDSTAQYTHYHQSCVMTAITQQSARGTAHAGTRTASQHRAQPHSPVPYATQFAAHPTYHTLRRATAPTATGPAARQHPTILAATAKLFTCQLQPYTGQLCAITARKQVPYASFSAAQDSL